VDLKFFPNKKQLLNFQDFEELFRKGVIDNQNQEEMLLKSFKVFDFDTQGYINSKKIKEIFDIFDENITLEEITSNILPHNHSHSRRFEIYRDKKR